MNFVAEALPSLVKETSRNSSIFVIQTPSSPETKIKDIHEWDKLNIWLEERLLGFYIMLS